MSKSNKANKGNRGLAILLSAVMVLTGFATIPSVAYAGEENIPPLVTNTSGGAIGTDPSLENDGGDGFGILPTDSDAGGGVPADSDTGGSDSDEGNTEGNTPDDSDESSDADESSDPADESFENDENGITNPNKDSDQSSSVVPLATPNPASDFYYTYDSNGEYGDGIYITGYKRWGIEPDIVVPAEIEGHQVVSINLGSNHLTALDVSSCTALVYLYCPYNNLTSLDVSSNFMLEYLVCTMNDLTSLNVNNNAALVDLQCSRNNLTLLNVSHNTELLQLGCANNNLTTLDVSNNAALERLYYANNNLTSLDVSHNTALLWLDCYNNKLTTLDVSNNAALVDLWCDYNNLTTLDVSHDSALKFLSCYNNNLTTLDVSHDSALETLYCYNNNLATLDVSHDSALVDLWCYSNNLTTLDVSSNTALDHLNCSSNNLTSLNVSSNFALTGLNCSGNNLTTLDVSNNSELFSLNCGSNNLLSPDVSSNTALSYLECDNNNLTTLDVSHNSALQELSCESNNLTSLDVSQNLDLMYLYCGSNNLATLDVSHNSALHELSCESSNLATLDVSHNTELWQLYCYNNDLATLNVSEHDFLYRVDCTYNRIQDSPARDVLIERYGSRWVLPQKDATSTYFTVKFATIGTYNDAVRDDVRAKVVKSGDMVGTLPTPNYSPSNYTFDGWYTALSGGTKLSSSMIVTANVTYYAHWCHPSSYTVTFNSNGGSSVASKTVNRNAAIGTLPKPTRAGYTLDGWYTALMGGTKLSSSVIVTANVTYYAHWITNSTVSSYKVTFNANGGTVSPSSKNVTSKETYGTLPTPVWGGHLFDGWYTAAVGGTEITDSSPVEITAPQTLYAHWTEAWKVVWNANGGKLPEGDLGYTLVGKESPISTGLSNPALLPLPTKTGYDFAGWFETAAQAAATEGSEGLVTPATVPTSNVTYYACWTIGKYDATFRLNGGPGNDGAYGEPISQTYGQLFVLPGTDPELTGKKFIGWYTAESGGSKITASSVVRITTATTYYAHWTEAWTVTLNANNAGATVTPASISVAKGKTVGTLPIPTGTNLVFKGWYTSSGVINSANKKISSSTKVTRDVTYYAQWDDAYEVSFDVNADSETITPSNPATKNVKEGTTVGTLPTLTRTGYTFKGWYTSSGAINITNKKISSATKPTTNVTYYAQWTAKTFTVTWNANGGKVTQKSSVVTYDSYYSELPVPTRIGYQFLGWYDTKTGDGANTIKTEELVKITKSTTMYARWDAISDYSVTFMIDRDGDYDTVPQTYGQKFVLPTDPGLLDPSDYPNPGYKFLGWYTNLTGGKKITATTTVSSSNINTKEPQEETYLYAHWTAAYQVNWDVTEGYDLEPYYRMVQKNATIGTLPIPTGDHLIFKGWYTADTNGKKISASTKPRPSAGEDDVTYYAQWDPAYQIDLETNGGTLKAEFKLVKDAPSAKAGTLAKPTRTGYTFAGWYTEDGTKVTAKTEVNGDATYYAYWTAKKYTVTFNANGGKITGSASRKIDFDSEYGGTSGTLPIPTRSGAYAFDGWYTEKAGGSLVTADDVMETAKNTTLYAHWI